MQWQTKRAGWELPPTLALPLGKTVSTGLAVLTRLILLTMCDEVVTNTVWV